MKRRLAALLISAALMFCFLFPSCDSKAGYHTVTVDYNIDWVPLYSILVKDGGTIYPPKDPVREDYVFSGWKTGSGEDFDFKTPVTKDMTIKAVWTVTKCTVTLKDKSGSVIKTSKVGYGASYTLPTDLGYTINSYTDESGTIYRTASIVITDKDTVLTIKELTYKDYEIGEIGPGGGFIVFDADNASTISTMQTTTYSSEDLGWRYLECAPDDLPQKYIFGYYRPDGTNIALITESEGKEIGKGKTNTSTLVTQYGDKAYTQETGNGKSQYAASAASQYNGGGYSDWFLPSSEELDCLDKIIRLDKGSVKTGSNDLYCASTEVSGTKVHHVLFFTGGGCGGGDMSRSTEFYIRPFRRF